MRPTLLNFRSPKEKTPEFYSSSVLLPSNIQIDYQRWGLLRLQISFKEQNTYNSNLKTI
jgi:hypothetical protein